MVEICKTIHVSETQVKSLFQKFCRIRCGGRSLCVCDLIVCVHFDKYYFETVGVGEQAMA